MKEKEVAIKLILLETGMTKKLETRQFSQSKLDNNLTEEGKLRSQINLQDLQSGTCWLI